MPSPSAPTGSSAGPGTGSGTGSGSGSGSGPGSRPLITVKTGSQTQRTVVTTTTTTTTFASSPLDQVLAAGNDISCAARYPLAAADTPAFLKKFTFSAENGVDATFSEHSDSGSALSSQVTEINGRKRPAGALALPSPAPKRVDRRRASFLDDADTDELVSGRDFALSVSPTTGTTGVAAGTPGTAAGTAGATAATATTAAGTVTTPITTGAPTATAGTAAAAPLSGLAGSVGSAASPLPASLLSPSVSPISALARHDGEDDDSLDGLEALETLDAPGGADGIKTPHGINTPAAQPFAQPVAQPVVQLARRPAATTTTTTHTTVETEPVASEVAPLLSIPDILGSFDSLPDGVKNYVLFNILRRCDRPTLSMMSSVILPALRRDLLSSLPVELAYLVLSHLDSKSLLRASRVSKFWNQLVDSADWVWRDLLRRDRFVSGMSDLNSALLQLPPDPARVGSGGAIPGISGAAGAGRAQQRLVPTPVHTPTANRQSESKDAALYREIYRRKYLIHKNWMNPKSRPKHLSFPGHNRDVVTCLQFDDDKIVTGSDDSSINVYDTATGTLRATLRGHEGGVWALQCAGDNTIVSGSTDRTVRIWNIREQRCSHIFYGHTSTVRCLDIVQPVPVVDKATGATKMTPPFPLIVTGSRDSTLRVWRLPGPDDPDFLPPSDNSTEGQANRQRRASTEHEDRAEAAAAVAPTAATTVSVEESEVLANADPLNAQHAEPTEHRAGHQPEHRPEPEQPEPLPEHRPAGADAVETQRQGRTEAAATAAPRHDPVDPYFMRALTGHSHNVRVVAGYGDMIVSGSYDCTVRVWNALTGECRWELQGHQQRVYSVIIDHERNRCISGSMDSMIKIWCLDTGTLLHTLEGHSSLVGLLELNNSLLVSGAADSTLRIWNPDSGESLWRLQGHHGPITCFQHDHSKVVSGSESTLKLWDVTTGKLVKDLLVNLNAIWQVKFDHRRCVAAVQRENGTCIEILDFDYDPTAPATTTTALTPGESSDTTTGGATIAAAAGRPDPRNPNLARFVQPRPQHSLGRIDGRQGWLQHDDAS